MNLRPYLQYSRKISSALTGLLMKTAIKPNHVTTVGLILGVSGGGMMAFGTRSAMLWGALLLHASFILDNCDGELARLKSIQTSFGKWYDLIADVAVEWALWTGLVLGSLRMGAGASVLLFAGAGYAGSFLNLMLVIRERNRGVGDSLHVESKVRQERRESSFFSVLETLSRNGDSAVLVWLMALVGSPQVFLVAGSLFINGLWMTRFAVNRKYLR